MSTMQPQQRSFTDEQMMELVMQGKSLRKMGEILGVAHTVVARALKRYKKLNAPGDHPTMGLKGRDDRGLTISGNTERRTLNPIRQEAEAVERLAVWWAKLGAWIENPEDIPTGLTLRDVATMFNKCFEHNENQITRQSILIAQMREYMNDQQYRQVLLEVIGKISPNVREKIIHELERRSEIQGNIDFS